MKTCGTCLNYRRDDNYEPCEYCACNPDRLCGYCVLACENYDPDVDYIKFMGFDKEVPND